MQRCAAQHVLSVDVSTSVEQYLFHIKSSIDSRARIRDCKVQCRALVLVASISISALRKQHLDHLEVLANCGNVQRCEAVHLIGNVDFSLVIDQVRDNCGAVLLDGDGQRRVTVQRELQKS